MGRRRRTLTSACALMVAATSCANDPLPERSAPAERTTIVRSTTSLGDLVASQGFVATVRQYREDDLTGVVQLQLWRGPVWSGGGSGVSDDIVTVRSVQLRWPGFAEVPPTPLQRDMVPSQRLDFPTPGSEVRCGSTSGPFTTPSYAEGVVVVTGDGPDGPFRVDAPLIEDAQTTLDRIYQRECTAAATAEQVGVELVGGWTRSEATTPTATGVLRITRRAAADPVRVDAVNGSVLLTLSSPVALGGDDATMAASSTSLDLPLEVVGSGRCDGHALGESKKTFQFQVTLRLGDRDALGVELTVDPADQPLMFQLIRDTCGDDHHR